MNVLSPVLQNEFLVRNLLTGKMWRHIWNYSAQFFFHSSPFFVVFTFIKVICSHCLRQGLANYGPQVNPVCCLFLNSWKMVFYILYDYKVQKEKNWFMTCENYVKFKIQCLQMFIETRVMLICLHTIHSFLWATTVESNSSKKLYDLQNLKYFTIWCFPKSLLI